MVTDVAWRKKLTDEAVIFCQGAIKIPNREGLGVEIQEEVCQQHPYQPISLRHYRGTLTDIRPEGSRTCAYFRNFDWN